MTTSPSSATAAERTAACILVLGAFAVVLAATPYKAFELDRFFVPKELVLAITTAAVGIVLIETTRRVAIARLDVLLVVWLLANTVSALFAQNHWLAFRALGVTVGGVAAFWGARAVACTRLGNGVIAGLGLATVAASVTALAQAYGWEPDYVSLNRAPGGTLGNRNFVAHLAAIGLPALIFTALTARSWLLGLVAAAGIATSSAALIMSRTRAAWLALIVAGSVLLLAALWRHRILFVGAVRARAIVVVLLAAGGAAAAITLPNELNWRSESPYLETATGVVNFREGSGRGRLIQYRNSMTLARRHPLVGVGPGNWAVAYPTVASRNDPSLASDGTTANPWPSSDWVAYASERGLIAFGALVLAVAIIALGALHRVGRATTTEAGVRALALAGTVMITFVVGSFDAVLLLGAPSLIAWGLIGALMAPVRAQWTVTPSTTVRRATLVAALAFATLFIVRGVGQAIAMAVYTSGPGRIATVRRAATMDPGSYRIQMRAAELELDRGSCRGARQRAEAARRLYPAAPAPGRILRRCR